MALKLNPLISTTAGIKAAWKDIEAVAATRAPVLICGEAGTGKSEVAEIIHKRSKRASGPFISLHLANIPRQLVMPMVFGCKTGNCGQADQRQAGRIQAADKGTLILEEIQEAPAQAQKILAELLEQDGLYRLDGEKGIKVDVRLIATSGDDLASRVARGLLRGDFYKLLNVYPIHLPALRHRAEDIPMLVRSVIDQLNRVYGDGRKRVADEVLSAFRHYHWPGNLKEFYGLLEHAYLHSTTEFITIKLLPFPIRGCPSAASPPP